MNFQQIFSEYYMQYRGDSAIPAITDPEWIIGVQYGNTAIRRFSNVDVEYWDFLWTRLQLAATGTKVYTSGTTTYAAPTNMKLPGGFVRLTGPATSGFFQVPVLLPTQTQLQAATSPYAYWTGDQNNGFTLNLNIPGDTAYNTWAIDYPYYKKPTYFAVDSTGTVTETGSTISEIPDHNFIINYMLAYRYRASRNWPAYQTAKADAETNLKNMQQRNGGGTFYNNVTIGDQLDGGWGSTVQSTGLTGGL